MLWFGLNPRDSVLYGYLQTEASMTRPTTDRKPVIYLAGPITGCKPHEIHGWRDTLKTKYADKFGFLDPTRRIKQSKQVSPDAFARLIVEGDRQDIMQSDAVLAHFWKESIGTAMGVMAAYSYNKPVVVVLPDRNESAALRQNHTIRYYAHSIVRTTGEGMNSFQEFFAGAQAWKFLHENKSLPQELNETEILNRLKLFSMECGHDSISTPRRLLDRVLIQLQALRKATITEGDLNEVSFSVLQGENPCMAEKLQAFLKSRRNRRSPTPTPTAKVEAVLTSGDHKKSMWGDGCVRNLKEIPDKNGARALLRAIVVLDGVVEVHLGSFSGDNCRPANTHTLKVLGDNGQDIIFARIHGRGHYKNWQDITIRVSGVELPRVVASLKYTQF
jgi:nucleoside 2-deoxyribosyltransferase